MVEFLSDMMVILVFFWVFNFLLLNAELELLGMVEEFDVFLLQVYNAILEHFYLVGHVNF